MAPPAPPAARSLFTAPKLLAIMPTLACPAACADCGSGSGPRRRCRLGRDVIAAALEEAHALGFANVAFTGGEATLEWETLLAGLRLASDLGLRPRLVTNAHWARSPDEARRRLDALVAHGLDHVNVSTGDEHARFVPLAHVVNAIVAALARGLQVHVVVEYRAGRAITRETVLAHPALKELSRERRESIGFSESPWMPVDPAVPGRYASGDTVDRGSLTLRGGCPSILQTYIVEADGRVAACCGLGIAGSPELYVGRATGTGFLRRAIETAEGDFLKLWLRVKGPEQVLAWAARHDPGIQWEGLYAHNCQACRRIYTDPAVARVIRRHHREVMADVLQSLWFDEAYYPRRVRVVEGKRADGTPGWADA